MHIKDLIKQIKQDHWTKIVIIGPEFSGTTISAWIIAKALKFEFISESFFKRLDCVDFRKKVKTRKDCVCQCPSLTSFAAAIPSDIFIVVIKRDLSDILMEQRRAGFSYSEAEKRMFGDHHLFNMENPLAHVKYEFVSWIARDRKIETVDFTSLEGHKLYIDHAGRRNLKPGQIIYNKKTPITFNFGVKKK